MNHEQNTADRLSGRAATDWAGQELLILREMGKLIGKGLDERFAIRGALHLLSEFVGLNRGRVLLPDLVTGDIAIRYAYGLTAVEIAQGRFKVGEGITGLAFKTGETLIVQDIDAEPLYLTRTVARASLPQETVAYIAQPFLIDGRIAGVLAAHRLRRRDRAITDDVQLMRLVASWIVQILKINALIDRKTAALETENRELRSFARHNDLARSVSSFGIVGDSVAARAALHQIEVVAQTDATVLLLGESGTGKELYARALHLSSHRKNAPFIRINCGAIPENLFESELFGHEKGAFTGASAVRIGRFEQASGGTIFLDEIGDMPLAIQVKLLRALQERVIERVGGSKEIRVDVRVVAATHQDLLDLVSKKLFRLDLFYRLNVVPVHLPALRERPEDIPLLVRHHLNQINQQHHRNQIVSVTAIALLAKQAWPGNVRELRNVLERAVLLADQPVIDHADMARLLGSDGSGTHASTSEANGPARPLDSPTPVGAKAPVGELTRIHQALVATRGNKSRAAQQLGLTLRQLNYRLSKEPAGRS